MDRINPETGKLEDDGIPIPMATGKCIDGAPHAVNMAGWGPPEVYGVLKPGEQRSNGCCVKCGKAVF